MDNEKIINHMKEKIQKTTNPTEAAQWSQCLKYFVIAISIEHELNKKLNS